MMRQSAIVCCWYLMLAPIAFADSDDLAGMSVYYLGGSLSEDNQYSIEASADYLFSKEKWLGLAAMFADENASSSSFPGASSTAFDISFGQSVGLWQYSLGTAWIDDKGLGNTAKYRAGFGVKHEEWTLRFTLEWRDAAFELDNFDALLRDIDTFLENQLQRQLQEQFPQVDFNDLIALRAELDIRSLAYGMDFTFAASDTLRVSATYSHFDYRDQPDRVRLSAGLNRFGDTDRGQRVLAQINRALINSVDGLAGDFRNGFYTRSASIGLDLDHGNHNWLLDIAYDKDAISTEAIFSASVQWIAPLGASSDLRIAIGRRQSDELGSSNQIGVGVFFYR